MDRTEAYEQAKTSLELALAQVNSNNPMSRVALRGQIGQALARLHDLMPSEQQPDLCSDCGAIMIEVCSGLEVLSRGEEAGACSRQPSHGAEVERVARALAAEDYRQKQRGDYNDADTFASRHWGEYQPEARVAIAAMPAVREFPGFHLVPATITLAMQKAYFEVIDHNMDRVTSDPLFGRFESQKEAYRAMLAAAPKQEAKA